MNELTAPDNIQENDVYIFIKTGNASYALPALDVLEIVKLVELEYPEKMPDFVAGLLEYQDKVILVTDLKTILDVETKEYDINTHILIIKGKNTTYGIIADTISDIKKIDTKLIVPPPGLINSMYTKGIYLDGTTSTTVINLDALENKMDISKNPQVGKTGFDTKAAKLLPKDIASKEILHKRKIQLVEKTKGVQHKDSLNKDVYISFLIGNSTYCLEIVHVGGFYKYSDTKIIKVPCTPEFVKGLISIKGDYLTIIDLKKYFDNESCSITEKSTIIAIQSKDFRIGFIVDEISHTMNIPSSELYKNSGKNVKLENRSEIIEYVKDDKLYLVLNINEILNDEKLYVG